MGGGGLGVGGLALAGGAGLVGGFLVADALQDFGGGGE